LIIVPVSSHDELGDGPYVHYMHHRNKNVRNEFLDIRATFEKNQSKWLTEVTAWHSNLSELASKKTSGWWFVQASRLLASNESPIENFCIANAVNEILGQRSDETVFLVDFPPSVLSYLAEIGLNVRLKKPTWYKSPARLLRITMSFLLEAARILRTAMKPKISTSVDLSGIKTIVYSHLLNLPKNPAGGDHFFGDMLQSLPNCPDNTKLWVYFNDSLSPVNQQFLKHHTDKIGSQVTVLQDHFTIPIALRAIYQSLLIRLRLRGLMCTAEALTIGDHRIPSFAADFYQDRIQCQWPMLELAIKMVFDHLLRKSAATNIIYPYEEKPLERAIIDSALNAHHQVRTIGVAHAIHNPVHLYLIRLKRLPGHSKKPTFIGTTGIRASAALNDWAGIPETSMRSIGTKRYREPLPGPITSRPADAKLKVLMIVSLPNELPTLASWVETNPELFHSCTLTVRKYPFHWLKEQSAGIQRIKECGIPVNETDIPLADQLNEADVVIYAASSAGFEAMLAGKYTIQCRLSPHIGYTPIVYGTRGYTPPHCKTANDLRQHLQFLQTIDSQTYSSATKEQISFAKSVYSPINKQAISDLLISPFPVS